MSNKTPKADSAKTALGHKYNLWYAGLATVVLLGIAALVFIQREQASAPDSSACQTNPRLETIELHVTEEKFTAEVAKDSDDKYQGLSDRDCLASNWAMLFPYDSPGNYCFVMRGMNFTIDMVWLDEDKKVVTIKDTATPESYPAETFCPDTPAQYIVELPPGTASRLGWNKGTQFEF